MQQIRTIEQNKKTSDLERLFICNNGLVRVVDTVWNQFETSLRLMQEKLVRLNFVMIAGEVVYVSSEGLRDGWI